MKLERFFINLVSMMTAMQVVSLLLNGIWISGGWVSISMMLGLTAVFSVMQCMCEKIIK